LYCISDENAWFSRLGYDFSSLAPQLYQPTSMSSSVMTESNNDLGISPLILMSSYFNQFTEKLKTKQLTLLSSVKTVVEPRVTSFSAPYEPYDPIKTTLYTKLYQIPVKNKDNTYPAANAEPLFGYGIVLSKASDDRVIVNAISSSNPIYRDVLISVFNESFLLPFSLVNHGPHGPIQDTFYFVKKDTERAAEDKNSLKRFGSELNTTLHEKDDDQGRKVITIIL